MYVKNYDRRAIMEQMAKMIGLSSSGLSTSGSSSYIPSSSGLSSSGASTVVFFFSNKKTSDESKIDIVGIKGKMTYYHVWFVHEWVD